MAISADGYQFDYDKAVPMEARPVSATVRGNLATGLLMMAFAVVWTGFNILVGDALLAEPMPLPLVLIPFLAVGIGLFVYGLKLMLYRRAVTIGPDEVAIDQRHWFRTRRLAAALDEYPGVLRKKVTFRRSKRNEEAFLTVLKHTTRDLTVVLAAARDEAQGRARTEDYARWLGKPALEETADGFLARDPDDLDKPLAKLVAEGKIVSGYREGSTPPAEIKIEQGAERIVVSFLKGAIAMWVWTMFAGIAAAAAFLIIGFVTDLEAKVAGAAAAFLVLVGVLYGARRQMRTTRQILIHRDRLEFAEFAARESVVKHTVRLDEIETVRVAKGRYSGFGLYVDTDAGTFEAGAGLPKGALEWVRDLIVAAIATADGSEAQA